VKSLDEIITEAAERGLTGSGIEEALKGLYELFGGANAETDLATDSEHESLVNKLSELFDEKGIQINPFSDAEEALGNANADPQLPQSG